MIRNLLKQKHKQPAWKTLIIDHENMRSESARRVHVVTGQLINVFSVLAVLLSSITFISLDLDDVENSWNCACAREKLVGNYLKRRISKHPIEREKFNRKWRWTTLKWHTIYNGHHLTRQAKASQVSSVIVSSWLHHNWSEKRRRVFFQSHGKGLYS